MSPLDERFVLGANAVCIAIKYVYNIMHDANFSVLLFFHVDRKRLIRKVIKGGLGIVFGVVCTVGAVVAAPAVVAAAAAAAATAGVETAAVVPAAGIASTILAGAVAIFRNVRP